MDTVSPLDTVEPVATTKAPATLRDYVRIARFEHMTKHVFIVPGVILAILLRPEAFASIGELLVPVLAGFASAVFVASANYVINEYLDREFDQFHPEKSQRAAVQRELSGKLVVIQYVILLTLGLVLATLVNSSFTVAAGLLALSGVLYNVNPVRTKDRVYLDVLSESLNNPIRLLMGWAMVDATSIPPSSLFLGFWMGGAFLMNSKRLAEYRDIVASDGKEVLGSYRRSFRYYTESSLSVANLVYALSCAFLMAVFLIKYRVEYVVVFPCLVSLFGVYYALALGKDSVARKPESLFRSPLLMITATLTCVLFLVSSFVDIPSLEQLTKQTFIVVSDAPPGK